jgi:hypothetical protein
MIDEYKKMEEHKPEITKIYKLLIEKYTQKMIEETDE